MGTYRISFLLILASASTVFSATPRILYTDLESGPNSGGQDDGGAFVSVYGNNFGLTRGTSTITVGGWQAKSYPVWTDSKITFQLDSSAATGNIVVTVSGRASNGVAFTVRPGNIYFVAADGSDRNSGSFASPWKTLQYAIDTIGAGDIVYARDGVVQASPSYDGSLIIHSGGAPGSPKALVAYPNAVVTIGATGNSHCTTESCYEGLTVGQVVRWWVFAGLTIRGNDRAAAISGNPKGGGAASNFRFVGNDFSCPQGGVTPDACVIFVETQYVQFYGNTVHDVGTEDSIDEYHGLYFSSDSNHVDAGWNNVYKVRGCRGIQVHSSPLYEGGQSDPTGFNMYDISIHDNLVHDTRCDGIILATISPEKGRVQIFNNVVYNAGTGPVPKGGGGAFSCIYISGGAYHTPDTNGTVDVYNNTLYGCGTYSRPDQSAVSAAVVMGNYSPGLKAQLRNNIVYQGPNGLQIWDYNAPKSSNIGGTNNLFFGGSGLPGSGFASSISADPQFANLAGRDFHLRAGSPATGAGGATGLATDRDGVPRPLANPDLGAYQAERRGGPRLKSLACNPPEIVTPGSTTCVIGLSDAAPDGAVEIELLSSSPFLTFPAIVPVAPQSSSVSATVQSTSAGVTQQAVVTAALGDDASSVPLTLLPPHPIPTSPLLTDLVNSASLSGGPISPGEIATARGSGLGPDPGVSFANSPSGSVGQMLAGTRVLFNSIPAPITSVQGTRVNLVVPYELAGKDTAEVRVEANGVTSNSLIVPIKAATPAIYTADSTGVGQAAALNEDGTPNSGSNPARAGAIVSLFVTGLGVTNPPGVDGQIMSGVLPAPVLPVAVYMSGLPADILYAGAAPGLVAGAFQINARVPKALGAAPVSLIVGGISGPSTAFISLK